MKNILLLMCILISQIILAHKPNEITYSFLIERVDNSELVVHFTPKSAIDLLRKIHPELENKSLINLNDYTADLTSYFNETIYLKLDDEVVGFSFKEADFMSHDATFTMKIEDLRKEPTIFNIKITSFTEVYKRLLNYTVFNLNGVTETCVLNKQNKTCSSGKVVMVKSSSVFNFRNIIIGFVLLAGIFLSYKRIRK